MKTDFDSLEWFCRLNVQSELPHKEFVSFIARSIGGVSRMNSVKSDKLDISVDDNDVFDAEKARRGKDRWLYFRYTLEIDPIEDVSPGDYVAAIDKLLKLLWLSGMDAVASCDFEDRLPRNVRRLKWAWNPQDQETVTREAPLTGGAGIMIPPTADPIVVLDACARIVRRYWIQARFEDPATGKKYHRYEEIPFGRVMELLVYPNSQAEAAWDADSPDVPPNSMLHLIRSSQAVMAVMDDPKATEVASMFASISDISMDLLDTYPEAA